MEGEELQQIAQQVEYNRQKLSRLEEQITKLAEIRLEQTGVLAALQTIESGKRTMIPLGAGVQLPATPNDDAVVIDIGSGVQAEKPRDEAIKILESRMEDVREVLSALEKEYQSTEQEVITLANTFNEAASQIQAQTEDNTEPTPTKKPRRKRRGSELTLDD
jgi:prefoldin alpha subunit